jgi:hypothetical protein
MAFTAGALAGDVPSLARWTHGLGLARGLARTPEGNYELGGRGGEITAASPTSGTCRVRA